MIPSVLNSLNFLKKILFTVDIQYYIKILNRKNESAVTASRTLVTWDQSPEDCWQRGVRKLLMVMEISYLLYKQYYIDCGGNYTVVSISQN